MSKNILYISSFLPADIPYAGNKTSFRIYNHIHKINNLYAYIFYNEIEEEFLNDFKNYVNNNNEYNFKHLISALRKLFSQLVKLINNYYSFNSN